MKLHAPTYASPIDIEGTFTDVFIEDAIVSIQKSKKYLSVTFEMYYFKNQQKIVLDQRTLGFYGGSGDSETSKKAAIVSIPNPITEPYEEQIPNPDYDVENPESLEFITVTITPSQTINVALMQYLADNNGELPEVYEVVDFGYPDFNTALQFFSGGERGNLDIQIPNPFARLWLKDSLVMKNQKVGSQFDFLD